MNKENGRASTDTPRVRTQTGRSEPNTACDTIKCRDMTATPRPVTPITRLIWFAPRTKTPRAVLLAGVLLGAFASGAHAQIAVSANDAKVQLINGVNTPVPNAPPDTVTVIELSGG